MDFYKLDFIARMLMVLNSSVNFVVYCSVSTPFKVGSDSESTYDNDRGEREREREKKVWEESDVSVSHGKLEYTKNDIIFIPGQDP